LDYKKELDKLVKERNWKIVLEYDWLTLIIFSVLLAEMHHGRKILRQNSKKKSNVSQTEKTPFQKPKE